MLLKTILCGPILRRTEPSQVYIWMATSIRPEAVNGVVSQLTPLGERKGWFPVMIYTESTADVHQLGGRLFVVLMKITTPGGFTPGTLYGYDIKLKFKDTDKVITEDKHHGQQNKGGPKEFMLTEVYKKTFCYNDLLTPVFVIPAQDKPSARIFYGSCRKTHGPGSDALNAADKELEAEFKAYAKDPRKRIPDHSLFLLGDQIYADDLHREVLPLVKDLASSLMGYDELIPEYDGIKEIRYADLADFLVRYRSGEREYKIEALNLPTKLAYKSHWEPDYKKDNFYLFLSKFSPEGLLEEIKKIAPQISTEKEFDALKFSDIGGGIRIPAPPKAYETINLNEILPRKYLLKNQLSVNLKKVNDITEPNDKDGHRARRDFVRRNSSISTDDNGHVISFGEFAALYLMQWGDIDFTASLSKDAVMVNQRLQGGELYLMRRKKMEYWDRYNEDTEVLKKNERHNLEGLFHQNRRVIRLFANVPTYMIFDDHEITDEWYCDKIWEDRIRMSVTGRRLFANALSAYWAFQGWGNDPSQFNDVFIKAIVDHLGNPMAKNGVDDQSKAAAFEKEVLSFHDWAFITPTNPLGIFMDNRTMRDSQDDMSYYKELNDNKMIQAARLMSDDAFGKIEKLLAKMQYKKGDPVIFCAPTPVLGSPLFEKGHPDLVDGGFNSKYPLVNLAVTKNAGRYQNDFESWASNPRGKYEFLRFIDNILHSSQVIILSGDVHYGFHAIVDLFNSSWNCRINQFTSSALKNNTLDAEAKLNQLSYATLLDIKEDQYRTINEMYKDPVNPAIKRYALKGHLMKYDLVMNKEVFVIYQNNIGLLDVTGKKTALEIKHQFLYSATYDGVIIKSSMITAR